MMQAHWLINAAAAAGLEKAQAASVSTQTPAGDAWAAVCDATGLSDSDLAKCVAAHFRLNVADMTEVQPRALKLVPEAFARRHLLLPLRETDKTLVVATSDPTNFEVERALGFACGRTPVFEIASPAALADAINIHYSPNRVVEDLLEGVTAQAEGVSVVEDIDETALSSSEIEAEPVVKLANLILRQAVLHRASDIHIEPGRAGGAVRFRVDGVLRRYMQLPMPALIRVVSRIKVLGQLDIADHLRPQDGRARIRVDSGVYDLRISTVPTREAEKAVIRILNAAAVPNLADIGIAAAELQRLRKALTHRDGIIVVTGPTGSGKSTTLYACLHLLLTEAVNIMTVEDPVEYELPGATQIQVEPKQGVTFASALRAVLRQDPDVIFIGEIRDLETAQIAVQASTTGHLVLATLHTNDAISVVQRLLDLGLDRPSIAGALRGVLAQRLVRRLCEHCSQGVGATLPAATEELASRLGVRPARLAVGCDRCDRSGYWDRMPVAEFLTIDGRIQDLILRGGSPTEFRDAAVAAGMRPMADAARAPVREGVTTLEELDRVLGERAEVEEEAAPGGGEPMILIVDDDSVNRTLGRTLLHKSGYRVSEAVDGVVALEKLAGPEEYALMVLDLDMPRLSGLEVLKQVRSNVRTAGLPVVVLTGTREEDAEIELMEAGADDYIRKPIDPPRFVARVKAALRRAGVEAPPG